MMTAHRTSTDIPDDPIGAYARESPPVFSQIHVPEISKINAGYLKSLPGILKLTTIVSCNLFFIIDVTEQTHRKVIRLFSIRFS